VQPVAIIGAGGHAREILDVFDAINEVVPKFEVVGFLVEPPFAKVGDTANGRPVLGGLDWLEQRASQVQLICGVGSSVLRRRLAMAAAARGGRFCNAIHPSVIRSRWIELGEGVVIAAGSVLTNRIVLGDHVHVNTVCTLAHDDVLRDYATLSPGCHLAGNVKVGEGAFLGIGVNVIPNRCVGAWAVIGAGATVTCDIPADATAVGVPARAIYRTVADRSR
jgi:sugar O-acyltransferase (sialic acid O-acetyltransferase NeuD family)